VRLVTALSMWWVLRGRLAGQEPLLGELAGRAEPGSDGWCAAQFWLARTAEDAPDLPAALERYAAVIDVIKDRGLSRMLVDCLARQSVTLSNLGRVPEATRCGRRALAMARELGYRSGQVHATTGLVIAAMYAGDLDDAVQLARQAGQIPDIPGTAARMCGCLMAEALAEAGDLAAAERACAATLARARDAGDMYRLGGLLPVMADLNLRAGRTGDGAAHLREARKALGQDRARAADERGAAMGLVTAAEYALLLTAPSPPPAPTASGAARLSGREREMVTLVARGRTDAQIAEQLYISIRTVRSHLDRIRDKTGCRRRADLTRLALGEHLV
jgi:DNA-binding CsgD family transcriptional regulator